MDQDNFNLNMFPDFSENLINFKQFSNDSFDYSDKNDTPFFEKSQIFEECIPQVFKPFPADNKKDILSEVYDISKVDEFIIHFQKTLDYHYFRKEFECIIEKIEKRFPFFFNEKTNGLLYIIQKLKFFDLIVKDRLKEAKEFFNDKLLILIKEIKKENWIKKSNFFMKLINKPKLLIKQGELQKKYYDRYSYELEKAMRIFLNENYETENNNNDMTKSKNDLGLLNSNSNNSLNHFVSSSSIEFNFDMKNNSNEIDKIITKQPSIKLNKENLENNEEDKDDLDLENCSTKEEFSDFEDEIQPKCVDDNQEQNNQNNEIELDKINLSGSKFEDNKDLNSINNIDQEFNFNLNSDKDIIKPDLFSNISSFPSKSIDSSFHFIEKDDLFIKKEKDEFIIDTSTKNLHNIIKEDNFINEFNYFKEKKSNNNILEEINTNIIVPQPQNPQKETTKKQRKKKNKNEETIFNQLPYLNSFKPKYVKRETIDKKIIRSFKNYVVKENKANRLEIDENTMDQNFFINFINGNVLPPIEFHDVNTDEYVKFNSFNCSYLLWFFSKKGIKEIYNQFITEKGKEFVTSMSQYYEISTEEKDQLNSYILNFPYIFDISLVNNIMQGTTVKHLYRTVDRNKKIQERQRNKKNKDNDLDLKRIKSNESQRERSRSRDFDNND